VAYNTTSDQRLKHDIADTDFSLEKLLKIKVRDYIYNADSTGIKQTGFIAQELYDILPNVVTRGGTDATKNPWTIDYGAITPYLTKALQELAQNTASTGALNTLSGQVATLSGQVALLSQSSGSTVVNNYYSSGTSSTSATLIDSVFSYASSLFVRVEATFSEMVTFMKSVVFKSSVTFEDRVTFSDKDMAGTATIKAGERSIRVDFSHPYTEVPRVTVTADAFVTYRVTDKMVTGFTIETQSSVIEDTNFDWMAIMVH